jgi:hypothetical protein
MGFSFQCRAVNPKSLWGEIFQSVWVKTAPVKLRIKPLVFQPLRCSHHCHAYTVKMSPWNVQIFEATHGYTKDSRDTYESDIGQKRLHKSHATVPLTYYFLGATQEKLLTATPVTAGTPMSQTLARSCLHWDPPAQFRYYLMTTT